MQPGMIHATKCECSFFVRRGKRTERIIITETKRCGNYWIEMRWPQKRRNEIWILTRYEVFEPTVWGLKEPVFIPQMFLKVTYFDSGCEETFELSRAINKGIVCS